MKDRTIRPSISGSEALYAAARARAEALGLDLSKHIAALVRADLEAAGLDVPPPLPPKRNGPKPKRKRATK